MIIFKYLLRLIAVVVFGLIGHMVAAEGVLSAWPDIKIPKNLHLFSIGDQVSINGLPIKVHGFVSAMPPSELVSDFRQALGKPLVENQLGHQLILGRQVKEHYISVQIEAADKGARGIIAITNLQAARQGKETTLQEQERWMSRLPAGSTLISHMKSVDGAKLSQQLIFINPASEVINRDRLKSLLQDESLDLEKEGSVDTNKIKSANEFVSGRTMFFKGKGKEAMATIHQDMRGQTVTVLSITTVLESFK